MNYWSCCCDNPYGAEMLVVTEFEDVEHADEIKEAVYGEMIEAYHLRHQPKSKAA